MKINDAGLNLLKSFEGCKLKAYQDEGGVWTIGFGHTGKDFGPASIWTQEQADNALRNDLSKFETGVTNLLGGSVVNDNQFSALVCFAYNVGLGIGTGQHVGLAHSLLLKDIYAGNFASAADQFLKWDHVNGKVDPGLLRRRKAERDLFLKED